MSQPPLEPAATATFVVRFWREWSAGEPRWRGRAQHVQSGEEVSFLAAGGLIGFLKRFGIYDEGQLRKPLDGPAAARDATAGSTSPPSSLQGGTSMERQEVKQLSDRLHAFYNAHDVAGLASMTAPGFRTHTSTVPGGGMDRDTYLGMWQLTWSAFPDLRYETQGELIDGDTVALRVSLIGTHLGDYLGLPATGRQVRVEVIDFIRYADGQAQEEWTEYNQLAMMQQLGLAPVQAAA